jgi:hypothetical protein
MRNECHNRLMVLGKARTVRSFRDSNWLSDIDGRFLEILECHRIRHVFLFETIGVPCWLPELSRCWPRLILVLDYEIPSRRVKGLARAVNGTVTAYRIAY